MGPLFLCLTGRITHLTTRLTTSKVQGELRFPFPYYSEMIVHKHWLPPILARVGGKTYLMPTWVEVPDDTELGDIKWEKEVVTPQPKRELKIIAETFVSSSDSTILYKTKKIEREDGSFLYTCDCPGHWRAKDKRCKHIKELEKRN